MLRTAILIVAAAAGCATKKDPPAAKPAPEPAAPFSRVAGKLTCDRVFPQALRDRYFKGATIEEQSQSVDFAAGCDVKPDGKTTAAGVVVTCHPNMKASRATTLASLKKNLHAVDLPGVGAAAVTLEAGGARSVSAWDDDSDCHATVTLSAGEVDLVALSKDVLSALPPR